MYIIYLSSNNFKFKSKELLSVDIHLCRMLNIELEVNMKNCVKCNKIFESNIINKWGRYCSVDCALSEMQRNKRIKLEKLLSSPLPKCINANCNNTVMVMIDKNKLSLFCSRKCGGQYNSKISRTKAKATMKARYGVEHANQHDMFLNKAQQTTFERYGASNISNTQYFKDKFKKVCNERYGVDNVFQLKEIKEKLKITNLKKYGTSTPQSLPETKAKAIQTNLKKYGVEFSSQSPLVRKKIIETNQNRYGRNSPQQKHLSQEIIDLLADKNKLIELNQTMTIFEIYKKYGGSPSLYHKKFQFYGIQPKIHYSSYFEKSVQDFIQKYLPVAVETRVNSSTKFEADIFIKDYQLAIECNGLYWHSELNGKDKYFHLNKTKFYEKNGIKLIHIFSDEWEDKQEICKSILLSKLGKLNTIGARKTSLVQLSKKEEIEFFNKNHLQGYVRSKICLALKKDDKILAAMSFGRPRFNKKYDWELLRFANILNFSVIGGAEKLFKAFRKENAGCIVSYCHRHLFSGEIYKKLNMKFVKYTAPSYYYTIDHKVRFNRIQFQKHKLKHLLECFDPMKSEWENMKENGYDRIWDCGNSVWAID